MMQPDHLNVFDYDGTLISVNSFFEINKRMASLFLKTFRWIALCKMAFWYLIRKVSLISHPYFKQKMIALFEIYLTEEEKKHLPSQIFKEHVIPEMLEIFNSSTNCILTTSAPYAYMSRINFDREVLVLSSFDKSRQLPDPRNFGVGKIENLKALFAPSLIHIDRFYTDSSDDQPMIDFSESAFRVTGRHIERIK